MLGKKVKHVKEKAYLIAWSLASAIIMTFIVSFLLADVDPSFFDSGEIAEDILGVHEDLYTVERVSDGDTIIVSRDGVEEKVRLIGIDTPETQHPSQPIECFGKEATDRLTELVHDEQVHLQSDPTQADIDRYGRLLRYVYLPDGTHINHVLVREGYAFEYTFESKPYELQADFLLAQREAQESRRGLWGDQCSFEAS